MKTNICKISGMPLDYVMSFGNQPLGNGFLTNPLSPDEYFYPMEVGFSEVSKMFQLLDQPNPSLMFHDHYAFYSSQSKYMSEHFRAFSEVVCTSGFLAPKDAFVVELGCNDGILLKHFAAKGIRHLGIEPSENVALQANQVGVSTVSEFFTEQLAKDIVNKHGQVDAFLAANVMCHIPDIVGVVKGIKHLLKPTGVVMFEDPYLGEMIEKRSYDQIYDEHVFLFSALSIKYLFEKEGLEIIQLEPQKTHGGSMRYTLAFKGVYPVQDAVHTIMENEKAKGLDNLQTFLDFKKKVEKSKVDLIALLTDLKSQGKNIAGYGAASKSTTILNYCNIGVNLIDYICDSTPIKQNTFTPGMHIPVVTNDFFKKNPPDYTFLFAWNHLDEIMAKEDAYTKSGGKWITHVPEIRVL